MTTVSSQLPCFIEITLMLHESTKDVPIEGSVFAK